MNNKWKKIVSNMLAVTILLSMMNGNLVAASMLEEKDLDILWLDYRYVGQIFKEGRISVANDSFDHHGYIDINGQEVIPLIYTFEPDNNAFDSRFYQGLARVYKEGKYGFIDRTGKTVIPFEYRYANNFSKEGYSRVFKEDNSIYIINKKGETVIQIDDDLVKEVISDSEGLVVYLNKQGKYCVIGENGKVIVPINEFERISEFSEGLAAVKKDGKWGFINKQGAMVIPNIYERADKFSEGLVAVEKNGKWGFVNHQGVMVIPSIYDGVENFTNGFAIVIKEGKRGAINKNGKMTAVLTDYDSVSVWGISEGMIEVRLGEKAGFVNANGDEVIRPQYKVGWISTFREGLNRIRKNGKEGYINKQGEIVVPLIFDSVHDFSEGVAIVKKDDRYGILKNPILFPKKSNSEKDITAKYSSLSISMNGRLTNGIEFYTINNNTYFKLRDIAMLARRTNKKFSVDWNGEKRLITIQTDKDYVPNGDELKAGNRQSQMAQISTTKIEVNGKEISPAAYIINNNTYFKLRDLGKVLDFDVNWNASAKRIELEME